MNQEQLQLEINVNIKDKKYLIKVPSSADLSQLVHAFLQQNDLNSKYHSAIIRLVKDKLAQEQRKLEEVEKKQVENERENTHMKEEVKTKNLKVQKQEIKTVQQTVNNKSVLMSKIQQQLESKNRQCPPDSRMVYEKWKMKEKKQKIKKETKNDKSIDTSMLRSERQKLSPDHFYKKGLKFKEQIEQNCEEEFKKIYPFKNSDRQICEVQKIKLHNRLCKQKKQINVRSYLEKKYEQQPTQVKQQKKLDPVKQKVKILDQQIDKALFQMIREKRLTPKTERASSKSPFRKTMIK